MSATAPLLRDRTPTEPRTPDRSARADRPATRLTPRGRRLVRIGRAVGVPLLVAGLITAGSPGWGLYTIKRGDTLSDIAARYHTTVAKLVQVNRLPGNGNLIYAGATIKVPGAGRSGGGGGGGGARSHLVVRGDTLSGIAARYGVSQDAVARANHLPSSNVVVLGTRLVIPGGGSSRARHRTSSSSGNTFAGRTYSNAVVGAAAHNRWLLSRKNLPSQSRMRDIIAAKARANGVDPALALAVSYQESGWNMHVVSVANAVGAMQVIPATTDWISGVVGRRLNPLDPHDNATTGVVLLRILTRAAPNDRQAIAGYYQGLRSVREHGMFPDTKRYVDNVLALRARFR
jgi:soluble lytic murein transglycosylase-like protein